MINTLVRVLGLAVCLGLFMLLPFLPGRYDAIAVPLSMMAQLVAIVGLLLVPVGVFWMVYEWLSATKRKRYAFALVGLVAASLVWTAASLGAMFESITLGAASLALLAVVLLRLWPRVRLLKRPADTERARVVSPLPLYLIIVPLALALMRAGFADPAAGFSRNRAIRNAAPLIADIEQYRVSNGHYPVSLVSVHPDYLPGIIGIKQYRYELNGDTYNLLFEQLSLRIGVKEIVMYNPRGEHAISSHAADVLQMTPAQLTLDRTRGHNEVRDTQHPDWKYFWFD